MEVQKKKKRLVNSSAALISIALHIALIVGIGGTVALKFYKKKGAGFQLEDQKPKLERRKLQMPVKTQPFVEQMTKPKLQTTSRITANAPQMVNIPEQGEYVKMAPMPTFKGGYTNYWDKVPSKFADYNSKNFRDGGFRVVPPAAVRKGAFIAPSAVLMPSYVNIGGYVDEGTMVDTWATVGSCAQIGKNVHLSGGVGIGGVLEPVQAAPTIIEDNCFIGARSEVVEGVIVEEGSVISMGVYIGQSTKIYNRETGEVSYGRIPAGSVVVSGNLPSKDGKYSLYCAVIVKQVDAKTRGKVGINELLRDI